MWMRAQRLDTPEPFGDGPEATRRAIEHLGYLQIDTINVIERCHHHILFTRIPGYRREHLHRAQTLDKSVFEYWTHALAYVPTRDLPFFIPEMRRHRREPDQRFASVARDDVRKVIRRIRSMGPVTIRDIDDDVLVEKTHPWASRKPSKRALQMAFFAGDLTINERVGMLKSYELMDRHFAWEVRPRPATEGDVLSYRLDRALRAQGLVSLDSICHLDAGRKPAVRAVIERRMREGKLIPVRVEGADHVEHWLEPDHLGDTREVSSEAVHILSPFDPLVIQRKRLALLFGYEHRFEAYVPKERRVLGYFALPVLVGDEIVAALDLKTDRGRGRLLMQKWTWIGGRKSAYLKRQIEDALAGFEAFQVARSPS